MTEKKRRIDNIDFPDPGRSRSSCCKISLKVQSLDIINDKRFLIENLKI